MVAFSVRTRRQRPGFLLASEPSVAPTLGVSATLVNPEALDPVAPVAPAEPSLPGVPSYPRLPSRPIRNFQTHARATVFLVGPEDFSDCFYSGDYGRFIQGEAKGRVELVERENRSLNPLDWPGLFTQGQQVSWSLDSRGGEVRVMAGWILGAPEYRVNGDGTRRLTLHIGGELALFGAINPYRSQLYCGPVPRTAGEAARLYAEANGLFTKSYPVGHGLSETSINNFPNDNPAEFYQELYSPTGQDVRDGLNGNIQVTPRPGYSEPEARVISFLDVIEGRTEFNSAYTPFQRIRVQNEYPVDRGFLFRQRKYTQISGLEANTRAYFQGGYQVTEVTETYLGDTLIYTKEETKGYLPTDPQPWASAKVEADPCDPNPFTTELAVISTRIFELEYASHASGSYLVTGSRRWLYGTQLRQQPTGGYELYNGILEYEKVGYENTPQIDPEVCSKNYEVLQTYESVKRYGLTEDYVYRLLELSDTRYTAAGQIPGLSDYVGTGINWESRVTTGQYSQENKTFIMQPPQTDTGVRPPASQFCGAVIDRVLARTEVQLATIPGIPLEARSQNAPFCYTTEQLRTWGERRLREEYAMAFAQILTVPYSWTFEIGQSVSYLDREGRRAAYLVWGIETNQTGPEATSTILLAKVL